jgi:hypothetical protein
VSQPKHDGHQSPALTPLRTLLGDQRPRAAGQQRGSKDEPDRNRVSAEGAEAHAQFRKGIDRLLARADARDAAGEQRDRAAEERDRADGSLPEQERQQSALDRIHAARDREWAAADRTHLLAAYRRSRAGHDQGLERGVEDQPVEG